MFISVHLLLFHQNGSNPSICKPQKLLTLDLCLHICHVARCWCSFNNGGGPDLMQCTMAWPNPGPPRPVKSFCSGAFEKSQDQNWPCFHQESWKIYFIWYIFMSYSQIFVCAFVIFQLKFLQAPHTSITACHEAYHGASLFSLGSAVAFDRALEICNESTCMLKMTRGLYIMVAAPKHDLSISIICAVYYI